MLRRPPQLLCTVLDANDPGPPMWAAMLIGGLLGFVWGAIARLWMRLISTSPEFTLPGSIIIVAVPTIFGTCAGLAFAARRHGCKRWRRFLPRALTVALFIPFGIGGGGPLMLTVLLATLAVTWPVVPRSVLAVLTLLILGAIAASGQRLIAAVVLVALIVAYLAWRLVSQHLTEKQIRAVATWCSRIARVCLLIAAAGLFVMVSTEIVTTKPGIVSPAYIAMYLLLLLSLFFGLRIGLQPSATVLASPPSGEPALN